MDVLWRREQATAEEVREALADQPHDSTVRTLLRTLESKGYVKHALEGKSYVYSPAQARDRVQRGAARSLLARLFGGSAEDLVLRLLEDEQITPAQLADIRKTTLKPRKPLRKGDSHDRPAG